MQQGVLSRAVYRNGKVDKVKPVILLRVINTNS